MEKNVCGDEDLLLLLHKEGYLIEILARLPVTTLLRFKSVCKSWCALIESSFFIDLHTATTFNYSAASSSKFGSFILHAVVNRFSNTTAPEHALFMLSSVSDSSEESGPGPAVSWWSTTCSEESRPAPSGWSSSACWEDNDDQPDDRVFKVDDDDDDDDQLVLKLDNLGFPSANSFTNEKEIFGSYEKQIAGSCNGLVCLHDRQSYLFNNRPPEVYLWNPATRQFRILPKSITVDSDPGHRNLVALGFDLETKDYKVVLITSLSPRWNGDGSSDCFCRVQVYSLSTDSWRLLENIPWLPGYPFVGSVDGLGIYLNGSCFFVAHYFYTKQQPCLPVNDRFIISFDFTKEIITPIQLPDHDRNHQLCLCYMGDKIALSTAPKNQIHCYMDFNIWVLNETGSSVNKGSWTKLHSFQIEIERPFKRCIPRGMSNDGKFALLETARSIGLGKRMNLYNLVTKDVKKNFLSCGQVLSKAHPYKPSLVSIIGGNGAAAAATDRVIGNGATNL